MSRYELQPRKVSVVTTTLRSISDLPSFRIRQRESLDYGFVMRNLEPQKVVEIPVEAPQGETRVGIYNVLSPYTQGGVHIMMLDTTPAYKATPAEIPDYEGEAMMCLSADIVGFLREMPGMDFVNWGYNNSPLNYGKQEEQGGGLQTLTTKHHIQIWNRRRPDQMVPLTDEKIQKTTRDFIKGDPLNKLACYVIYQGIEQYGSQFVDEKRLRIDRQGLHTRLTTDLLSALKTPGFFSDFIKPLHQYLEQATADVWDALTTSEYNLLKNRVKEEFEGKTTDGCYDYLQTPPILRQPFDRSSRIQALEGKGYPNAFLRGLARLNRVLKDQKETDEENWIRKGLGYTFILDQDKNQNFAAMHIRPAILIPLSRGGVVETLEIALKRSEVIDEQARQEIEENKKNIETLRKHLPNEISV